MEQTFDGAFMPQLFNLVEVTKGVYAALETGEQATGSNAGFVDLGDKVVVFDSFLNHEAAKELRQAIWQVTGKHAALLVNSHYHMDHVIGNNVFGPDTTILSTTQAKQLMQFETAKSIERIQELDRSVLHTLEQQIAREDDPGKLADLKNRLLYFSNILHPEVAMRYPDTTFRNGMVIEGTRESMELFCFEGAHSPGDAAAYLPDSKVCFAGDLVFAQQHPWIGAGNPYSLMQALEQILRLDVDYVVPGHGPLASRQDVELELRYIRELISLVQAQLHSGKKTITLDDISPEFREWGGPCFQWNVNFLLEWLPKQGK